MQEIFIPFLMNQKITFDQLPKAVMMLIKEVSDLKSLLLEKRDQQASEIQEQPLTVPEAAKFLNLSVATIYSKVSKSELPVLKRGKRLYFSNTELMDYLKAGRKKSNREIDAEAETYLSNTKKGLNNGK